MNDNQMVVADAAALLGVNVQRVRALLAAGELSGTKVGSVWLVDPVSLAAYRHVRQPHGGRALAPITAWAALLSRFAADVSPEVRETFDVKDERRRRLLALAGRDLDDWRWLARRRADVHRYDTHPRIWSVSARRQGWSAPGCRPPLRRPRGSPRHPRDSMRTRHGRPSSVWSENSSCVLPRTAT